MTAFGKLLRLFAALALLCSCSPGQMQQAGTETGNGASGCVKGFDGKPAIGAKVSIVPVNYNELEPPPDNFMIAATVTDSLGHYAFGQLFQGVYNLFADGGSYKGFLDSVTITGIAGDTIRTITLKKSGAITGSAFFSSGRNIDYAFIALQGSRFYTVVDPQNGSFHFEGLAPGVYLAKIVTRTNGYFDMPFSVRVDEGGFDTIPNPFFLVSNSVTALACDSGGIWIGTMNGCARRSGAAWRAYGLADGLSSSRINCFVIDKAGIAWIGTSLRLARVDNGIVSENTVPALNSGPIDFTALATDSANDMWIGTMQGLFVLNGSALTPVLTTSATNALDGPGAQNELTAVTAILCMRSRVMVGTQHGAYYRDTGATWHEVTALRTVAVSSLASGRDSTVWIGTNQGLYSLTGAALSPVTNTGGPSTEAVTCLGVKQGDTLCVGTVNGLYCYAQLHWTRTDMVPQGSCVSALAVEPGNTVWVGTNDGIIRIENDTATIIR